MLCNYIIIIYRPNNDNIGCFVCMVLGLLINIFIGRFIFMHGIKFYETHNYFALKLS
jgi:hypothetical protein